MRHFDRQKLYGMRIKALEKLGQKYAPKAKPTEKKKAASKAKGD